jgi:AcrR family transcriptional regulator
METVSNIRYPLRERKIAKSKVILVNAFINRLKKTRISEISIKDICAEVEIAEATFYNYFPHKIDVLCFYEKCVRLKIIWAANKKEKDWPPLKVIDYTFSLIAKDIKHPFLFYELISTFISERVKADRLSDLTEAEKYFAFPDCQGIHEVRAMILEDYYAYLIKRSKKSGDLPRSMNTDDLVRALMSILIGVPLSIKKDQFDSLKEFYHRQLSFLWGTVCK